ncbi:MAG: PaaI family thioesterase [Thaumarchaeota archaeon]|nr:PaaI family thioesterase [Nitrososphaerota archaeon]
MSFEELLKSSGGFKGVFELVKNNGRSVEQEVEKFLSSESGLFSLAKFSVRKIEKGYAELSFPFSYNVARHGGMVHGGIISFALDNVGGLAVMSNNSGFDQVTLELKVNFLEPLKKEPFLAIGRELRHGRTTAVAEAEMRDGNNIVCAIALGTWYKISKH